MKIFITATISVITFTVLLGIGYPLAMTGLSQLLFPNQSHGSLIRVNGNVVGSELIGQSFSDSRHFHSRPSAAGNGYDATKSSGSNLGPTSKALIDRVSHDADSLRALYNSNTMPIDMVTTSGSGLDPHISAANARLQAKRVARSTGLSEEQLNKLIEDNTDKKSLGFLGEDGVNVLKLNLALDKLLSTSTER